MLGNDVDVDGDTLTVNTSPVVGPTNGTLSLAADGTSTYTPDLNFFGSDSFTYEVNDGNGGSSTATVTIDVVSINDAPVAADDNFVVDEDATLAGSVLDNDSDIDGDTLVVNTTPVVEPTNGSVVLNADGTFVYTPNVNFSGSDLFVYEVSDSDGETAQATVNITVDSLNDAPVAADDTFTTNEDVALTDSVLSNDSDLDGCLLYTSPSPRDRQKSRMPSSA